MNNEIREYIHFGQIEDYKEMLDDHFGQTLTEEDMDELLWEIKGSVDRESFMEWVLDYLSWEPNSITD